jgi:ribosomal protein S18 acetylase RimI-like enzyme
LPLLIPPGIREGAASDAERLSVLATQVWLHTYATDGIDAVIARYVLSELGVDKFEHLLAQERVTVLVAEIGPNIVGYAVVDADARCPSANCTVEVVSLYVQEHFARKGIGSSLLAASRNVAQRSVGSATIWLKVYAQNWPAIAFYRKHGLVKAGTAYFELGGEKHENHVLVSNADPRQP